jgi:hypothetical protein
MLTLRLSTSSTTHAHVAACWFNDTPGLPPVQSTVRGWWGRWCCAPEGATAEEKPKLLATLRLVSGGSRAWSRIKCCASNLRTECSLRCQITRHKCSTQQHCDVLSANS